MTERIAEITARHKAATPGPYRWIMRSKTRQCKLVTDHSGQYYVMEFERWGMQDACPTFQTYEKYDGPIKGRHGTGMVRAEKLAKPIGGLAYRIGHEEYIDHPDAIALEKSWEDIDYLLSQLAAKEAEIERLREAQRWRDAETEPPQKEGDYLVLCESGDMYNCFYDESIEEFGYYEAIYDNRTLGYVDSEWHKNETVTHWMPLPSMEGLHDEV